MNTAHWGPVTQHPWPSCLEYDPRNWHLTAKSYPRLPTLQYQILVILVWNQNAVGHFVSFLVQGCLHIQDDKRESRITNALAVSCHQR